MFFFFTTTTTTEIYTFSLHDALPILALLHGSEHLLRSRRGGDSGERRVQRALHRVHLRAAARRTAELARTDGRGTRGGAHGADRHCAFERRPWAHHGELRTGVRRRATDARTGDRRRDPPHAQCDVA